MANHNVQAHPPLGALRPGLIALSGMSNADTQGQDKDSDSAGPSTNRTSPTYRSHKHIRAEENARSTSADHVIECTVGPICCVSPQTFTNQQALQSHYIKAHSFICRGLVSPRKLHQRESQMGARYENGNTLGEGQREDSELEECGRIFPEERLLELIGDLLQRFGPGVSLIRPAWAPRPSPSGGPSNTSLANEQPGSSSSGVTHGVRKKIGTKPRTTAKHRIDIPSPDALRIPRSNDAVASAADSNSENGENSDCGMSADDRELRQNHTHTRLENDVAHGSNLLPFQRTPPKNVANDTDMDALALSLADTSLGFVPRGVRRKQKEKGKALQAGAANQSDNSVEKKAGLRKEDDDSTWD
ncbi:hypothetical protein QFC21_002802 [Naganishia friedmannii]|uniref:Uncharacterized protein n=1 Tax=Naganishia friedmannii TaxID=89922 RepID=A0ACC2VU24_9TREE|nr:hypothetical protein QFC21_002802 [Naganishia friedmannii]